MSTREIRSVYRSVPERYATHFLVRHTIIIYSAPQINKPNSSAKTAKKLQNNLISIKSVTPFQYAFQYTQQNRCLAVHDRPRHAWQNTCKNYETEANASSKAAIRSFTFSVPIDRRIVFGLIPCSTSSSPVN